MILKLWPISEIKIPGNTFVGFLNFDIGIAERTHNLILKILLNNTVSMKLKYCD